jgi:SH3 domain protein
MRLGSLILLTALSVPCSVFAEQTTPMSSEIPTAAAAPTAAAQAPTALELQLQQQTAEQDAQLQAAREENQRLRQRLRQAQANSAPPPLISEQQTWYLIGAGTLLLGALLGALLRGSRRTRREWLN